MRAAGECKENVYSQKREGERCRLSSDRGGTSGPLHKASCVACENLGGLIGKHELLYLGRLSKRLILTFVC